MIARPSQNGTLSGDDKVELSSNCACNSTDGATALYGPSSAEPGTVLWPEWLVRMVINDVAAGKNNASTNAVTHAE